MKVYDRIVGIEQDEGQSCYRIQTEIATYFYQDEAGGFSSLLDRDGCDWISFHPGPQEGPAGAAAMYRGIPNLVNPDDVGHPGHRYCKSRVERPVGAGQTTIHTESVDGAWAWHWNVRQDHAVLTIDRVAALRQYWFLYEGPTAGKFDPAGSFFGTDRGGRSTATPDLVRNTGVVAHPMQWAYFGQNGCPRVLLFVSLRPPATDGFIAYMGSTIAGNDSDDGMTVFGFGRKPGTVSALTEPGQFAMTFVESTDHNKIEAQALALARR